MQMLQNIQRNGFLVWQTLQNNDNLILANGAKAFRRKTPAQPIYTTVHCRRKQSINQSNLRLLKKPSDTDTGGVYNKK